MSKEAKKQINVVQFLPYFPPHKWGLETVAAEFSKFYVQGGYGKVVNVVSSVGQKYKRHYKQDGYEVLIIPSFDIVYNYSVPKFWTKQFWSVLKKIKTLNPDVVQTHTRFFLFTFLGGIFAKIYKKKRVHIEHGSGLVAGLVWRKKIVADLYDHTFGRLVFWWSDEIVIISEANRKFVQRFCSNHKKISLIYRGYDFPKITITKDSHNKTTLQLLFVWRLVKLKGVQYLLAAIRHLVDSWTTNFHLNIIGDGDERATLEDFCTKHKLHSYVSFLGAKQKEEVLQTYFAHNDIFINPSLQEGLPTTVLEALYCKNIVVATDVGGTREISNKEDLILVKARKQKQLSEKILYAMENLENLRGLSYDTIEMQFSWENSIRKYLSVV